jgi:hypothetical protein
MFLGVILLFTFVTPAAAAAINDEVAGAIAISTGTTVTEDTTLADTTDPFEDGLNESCGAPVVEHGVWFEVTVATDSAVLFNVEESDYGAGLMLFPSTVTAASLITCGPGQIVDELLASETYYLLVFGDGSTAATSGEMILRVEVAVPAPDISLTIDPLGIVDRNGVAHISGTVSCTSTDGSGVLFEVFGDLSQKVGRVIIRGFFGSSLDAPCDGTTIPWEASVLADNGLFAGGKAAAVAIAFGCTDVCSEQFVEATIQLRRSGR